MSTLPMVAPLEIGFRVRNLPHALAFWRDLLGLAFVSELETTPTAARDTGFALSGYRVVRLQLPTGERVKLFSPDLGTDALVPAPRPPLDLPGFAFVTLILDDLGPTLERLTRAGHPPRVPPYELRPGVHVALVDDPDGNVVELVAYADVTAYRPRLA